MAVSASATPDCAQIKFGADNLVELNDAQDTSVTPVVNLTGATVSATFFDEADDSTILGPLAMPEFPSAPSNDYRASFFASGGAWAVGQRVRVEIDFDAGAGLRRIFTFIALVCE